MGGDDDGKGAQAPVAGEPTAQDDQAAQAVTATDVDSGDSGAPDAGMDYASLLAARDARIEELEGQIAEASKTVESAEKLRAEMDELRRQGDEQRVAFELTMAGARNVKAATALLSDYDNDVEKLKQAEPWLFPASGAPAPSGATGLPNAGAASDEGATMKRWRKIAGIEGDEE